MYDLLFGCFLFWILFSIGCGAIAEPIPSVPMTAADEVVSEPASEKSSPSGSTAPFDVELKTLMDEVFNEESIVETPTLAEVQVLPSIDVDSLNVLQARRLCKLLGLPQKVKRKDVPIPTMRAQIAARLRAKPDEVEKCLSALRAA